MSKALLILRHEFGVTLRRPSYLIFSAAVPVLATLGVLGLLIYQAATGDEPEQEEITAGIFDLTEGPDGEPLFNSFLEQDNWTFELVDDIDAATQRLLDDDLDRLYVIPEDFVVSGIVHQIQRNQAGLGALDGGGSTSQNSPLGKFLANNLFVGRVVFEGIGNLAPRVLNLYNLSITQVDGSGDPVEDSFDPGRLLFSMALGGLLIMSVLTTSGYLLQGLNEEKENRIMEILVSSAKPEQLMVGKLLGLGSAGLFQILIWVTSALAALLVLRSSGNLPEEISLSASVPAIAIGLVYFVLGYFLFGTLMAALGAVTTSQREAGQVTFIIVLPGVVPFWFLAQIIQNPESTLARVLSFIPLSAPLASLFRLGVNGMGPVDLAISLTLLVAAVVGTMWLTIRLFRTYLLMYGQRPTIKQIFSTLRQA